MKWTDYMKNSPDEESCKVAWKQYRDRGGVTCPHCGCKEHYWEAYKECYECKKCGYRQSLKADTVLHKLRDVMGKRNSRYGLDGTAGLGEGFFTAEIPEEGKGKPPKRGRGSQRKTAVAAMAGTAPGNDGSPKRGRKPTAARRIGMLAVGSLRAMGIDPKVRADVNPKPATISDSSTSYTDFNSIVKKRHARAMPKGRGGKALP